MRKKGWILLLVLLCVAFLMSCGNDTEPDEAKGELVRIEREGCQDGVLLLLCGQRAKVRACIRPWKLL
nr:hypothetical protein [uncultured Blautia sp.]